GRVDRSDLQTGRGHRPHREGEHHHHRGEHGGQLGGDEAVLARVGSSSPPASRCARGAAGVPPARAAVAVPVHSDAPGAADGAGCDASMPRFVVLPARVRGTPRAFAGGGHARARSIRPVSASWTAPEVSTFSSTPAKATAANVPTAYSAVDMPLSPRIFEANRPPQLGFVTPRI